MDQTQAIDITRQAIVVALMVAGPVLAVALFIGVAVSVFQAVTQVQELTLTYVPKLIGAGAMLVLMGGWMLSTLVGFTTMCFEQVARLAR
jgi:flagellar biosynthetic protein FliQ